jgi:hypothetical protein
MIAISFFIAILAISLYFLVYRNFKTYSYLNKINNMCYQYAMKLINEEKYDYIDANDPYRWCIDQIPSYGNISFSFQEISIENILTVEQINKFKEVLGDDFLNKEYPNAR